MHTRQIRARLILLLLFLTVPALSTQAQKTLPLRLVRAGRFLPAGTVVLVFAEPAASPVQYRLLSPGELPGFPLQLLFTDTLDVFGRSRLKVVPSKTARRRYFLYARHPDGTLYWSFDVRKSAPKFDVVETGVMAVAEVPAGPLHDAIGAYFNPSPAAAHVAGAEEPTLDTLRAAASPSPPVPTSRPPSGGSEKSTTIYLIVSWALVGLCLLLIGVLAHSRAYWKQTATRLRAELVPLRIHYSNRKEIPDAPAPSASAPADEVPRASLSPVIKRPPPETPR